MQVLAVAATLTFAVALLAVNAWRFFRKGLSCACSPSTKSVCSKACPLMGRPTRNGGRALHRDGE
jgi:hypothetical protein